MEEEKNLSSVSDGNASKDREMVKSTIKAQEEAGFVVAENEPADKYELSLESMLKAGVHFGHKKSRWNPKMEQYIFGLRNGIHIINLEKTINCFEKALEKIEEVVSKNGIILIVGTKRQSKDLVQAVAKKIGIPFVNERWLGGTFTNFDIIKKRLKYLVDTKESLEKGRFASLTKLEKHKLMKKLDRIEEKMGGLIGMNRLPDLVIVLDTNKEKAAIDEAKKMGIPMVGLIDSNSNPDLVEYPIPANDDALSSLKYVLGVFLKKIIEAKNKKSAQAPSVVAN